ncbi:DegT/DnrJ/EryC1/StrS family aminotransferase [Gammaproteobacteria bacterium]|jgi:dTDP-4-amino-4,6-dideoxygalactose transaminase|nr:DegT/DnrJ/EryC1/StrS family aminotransferase [Gammaproteobacteria bacterium]
MESLKDNKIIKLSKSCISDAEKIAVQKVLDHEYLGMGAEVKEFEDLLSNYFGRQAACVVNGTAALHLALQAVNIEKDDEVLVQSNTYVASFQAISATGAIPIPCDIDPLTLCLDIYDAEKKLTSRTKAIMPVHYAGGVGDLDEIYQFASKNKLRVIEDAAHAFGSKYNSKKIGSFGDIACFSFDGIKNITSGEGGCVVSNDKDVMNKICDARLLGVEKDTEKRYSSSRSWVFDVKNQGWRYHMSNIMAAIGIEQFKRFEYLSKKRQKIAKKYDDEFKKIKEVSIFNHNYDEIVPHIYVILLDKSINRSKVQEILHEKNIQTGMHWFPAHELSFFKKSNIKLPVTNDMCKRILTLPLHPDLSDDDIDLIVNEIKRSISIQK